MRSEWNFDLSGFGLSRYGICKSAIAAVCLSREVVRAPNKTLNGEGWCLHLFVHPRHWLFGYRMEWEEANCYSYGFGPFFLLCILGRLGA